MEKSAEIEQVVREVEEVDEIEIKGLTDEEVQKRIQEGKVNGDQDVKTKSVGKIIADNVFTLFNAIFVAIAVILAVNLFTTKHDHFAVHDFSDFGFLIVMLINLAIGIIQELKAKKTIDKLSLLSAPKVTVLRNGEEKEISLKDIVLDDIVVLSAGRQICSDSVVADGFIEVNESLITGEPDAIPKKKGDELLSGSFVVSGTAKTKVIRIGKDNYATKISSGAKYIKNCPSEIRRTLIKFIRFMGILIIPLGAALFCVKYFLHGNPWSETVRAVMGSLIGMIPSGLVALTSAVFCVSVIRLSKHKALAQDLYCVETLARVNVLCLDKTGTLTEGSMEVEEVLPETDDDYALILKNVVALTQDNNVTANALKEKFSEGEVFENVERVIPFSSKYKFSGFIKEGTAYLLGAPEFIAKNGLGEETENKIKEYAENGRRVLALVKCEAFEEENVPAEVTLVALVIISDKIRKEAPDTLKFFDEQGVEIKIISGDNPITVSKIAERAGVKNFDRYVDATTLDTEEKLNDALDEYTVFGRTTPDQKLTLVKLLKKKKKTVAMTGDGVNDVLALRESDCSIAMASGSDAAKNVSQLVLLDSNFACLPRAVAEGRRTINNLERSASLFIAKTMYNLLLAIAFLFISMELPFEPRHMTFISFVTIGLPSAVLALEPNKELVTGGFFRKVLSNALPLSLTVLVCVVTATLASKAFGDQISREQLSTVCTVITGFIGLLYVAKVSWPLNAWRIVMLVCLILIMVGAFFIRLPFFDAPKFYGLSTDFNKPMIILLGSIGGGSVPLFVGMIFAGRAVDKKLIGKRIKLLDSFDKKGE